MGGVYGRCVREVCMPVTHVLVDSWMITVYTLSNVPNDFKWTTNTHVTPFTPTFKA